MPQRGPGIPPVGIVFDSDLGNEIDAVLALAMLYGLDGKGECRVVATTVSKPNLKSAALSAIWQGLWLRLLPIRKVAPILSTLTKARARNPPAG